MDVLTSWHLIREIEQNSTNSTSSLHPKRYCYDIGIAQDLRNMPFPNLSLTKTLNKVLRTQLGGILENAVYLSLVEYKFNNINISGWKENKK